MHSFGKLITKCLANRLATVLGDLVRNNQSAFIKGRSIHDNVRDVQLTCKSLHKLKMTCVLLKVDVAKAFDSVAWVFLLEVLQHMGFGLRWRNWMTMLLSTASTRILLNGKPGQRVCHARGLRQGDPLSPMLFVLVMEVLNSFLTWVEEHGYLTPLAGIPGARVSLYADDLVIFVVPSESDLLSIKGALSIFGLASGLFSNLDKSMATPIHCSEEDMDRVQRILACKIVPFPCCYLGVPLSVHRLKRADEQALIDKVAARIPAWKGNLLNAAGRTELVKSTLSAIPVHTSIALCLSTWAIEMIDKLRRAFIWAGTDTVAGGKCKVAWLKVCRPKVLGGLGVTDLRKAEVALRVRWVWKDRLSGRAPASGEHAVLALFQAATLHRLGNGRSTFFWTDRWLNGSSLEREAPTAFAAVGRRRRRATVAEALPGNAWVRHIRGPASMQMLLDISHICDLLEEVQLSLEPDTFCWTPSPDQRYSSASAYGAMFFGSSTVFGAKFIWKTPAPPRVRFFYWLAMHNRCWTGDRRFRHGLQDSNLCIFCDQEPETLDHIILGCCFSREVWLICLSRVHINLDGYGGARAMEWWIGNRKLVPKFFRRGFDSFVLLLGWSLWKERNHRTFQAGATSPPRLAMLIKEEAERWCAAGNAHLSRLLARASA